MSGNRAHPPPRWGGGQAGGTPALPARPPLPLSSPAPAPANRDGGPGDHDYSWGPGGFLFVRNGNTTYTRGAGQRTNELACFCQGETASSAAAYLRVPMV